MLSDLCKQCNVIFEHWEENTKYYSLSKRRHCKSIFALKTLADAGCPLCAQFYRNLVSRGLAEELQNATVDLLNEGLTPGPGRVMIIPFERLVSTGSKGGCLLLELHFRIPRAMAVGEMEIESDLSDSDDAASYDSEVGLCVEYVCKVVMMPRRGEPVEPLKEPTTNWS
jgi:hypothetical protein